MPVLPAVPSTMTPPGCSSPRASASRTMNNAARSFTDPPGLRNSHFPRISQPVSADALRRRTNGVLPMRSMNPPRTCMIVAAVVAHGGRRRNGGEVATAARPPRLVHSGAMQIVVLDGYTLNPGDNPWDALARCGELAVFDRTPPDQVVTRAADAAIVLTNKTVLTAEAIAALPSLRFIAVLATGYDVVDIAAARRRAIPVANVPEYGTSAVAQHTLALLLELCHRVGDHARAVAAGEWTRATDFSFWFAPPVELDGLTMGIVGFGRIGQRVAALAHAFGMRVIASGRSRSGAPAYSGFAWRPIPELFA